MCIVEDAKGNQLLNFITGIEAELIADESYCPLTSALLIVKGPQGFMLLKNKYRNEWELPGGMIDSGESPREAVIRECMEESGCQIPDVRFLGMLRFFLKPSWHLPEERIEYTALYAADITVEHVFCETEEMLDLCWHKIGEPIADASRIDLQLLAYYKDEPTKGAKR